MPTPSNRTIGRIALFLVAGGCIVYAVLIISDPFHNIAAWNKYLLTDLRKEENTHRRSDARNLESHDPEIRIQKSGLIVESDHTVPKGNLHMNAVCKGRLGNIMLAYAALFAQTARNVTWSPFLNGRQCKLIFETFPNLSIPYRNMSLSAFKRIGIRRDTDREIVKLKHLPSVNITPDSYFVSHKYFTDYEREIREEFRFSEKVRKKVSEYYRSIRPPAWNDTDFVRVGIQVRRTDLLGTRAKRGGLMPIPLSYFYHAMEYFSQKYDKVQFIVTSDDIEWCKNNLNWTYIAFPHNSFALDLAVLTMCDHVITTPGTYSWWAGWLCKGTTIYYGVMPDPKSRFGVVNQNKSWVPPPDSQYNKWHHIV